MRSKELFEETVQTNVKKYALDPLRENDTNGDENDDNTKEGMDDAGPPSPRDNMMQLILDRDELIERRSEGCIFESFDDSPELPKPHKSKGTKSRDHSLGLDPHKIV